MKINQRRYNTNVIAEFKQEIRDLLPCIPCCADVYLPSPENGSGKRVSFRLHPQTAQLSWEVDLPNITGPLDGGGDLFGDQIFTSASHAKNCATYSATIRRSDGTIIEWNSPTHCSEPHTVVGWVLSALSGLFSRQQSSTQQNIAIPSPNDYSRATSVLRDLTHPPRLDD